MWAKLANIRTHSQAACLHFFCRPHPLVPDGLSGADCPRRDDAGEVPFALGAGSCLRGQGILDGQWRRLRASRLEMSPKCRHTRTEMCFCFIVNLVLNTKPRLFHGWAPSPRSLPATTHSIRFLAALAPPPLSTCAPFGTAA